MDEKDEQGNVVNSAVDKAVLLQDVCKPSLIILLIILFINMSMESIYLVGLVSHMEMYWENNKLCKVNMQI